MTTQTSSPLRGPAAPGLLAPAGRSHWAALPVLLAGTFMCVLDFFIVNVALGSIRSGLHASGGAIEWIVAGYSLTGMRPKLAGATTGALTTMQNVGNALGVAVIGVVFFDGAAHGFGHAFGLSVAVLAAVLAAVAALTRLLPAPVAS